MMKPVEGYALDVIVFYGSPTANNELPPGRSASLPYDDSASFASTSLCLCSASISSRRL